MTTELSVETPVQENRSPPADGSPIPSPALSTVCRPDCRCIWERSAGWVHFIDLSLRSPEICVPIPTMISRRNLLKLAAAGALGSATGPGRALAQTSAAGKSTAASPASNDTKLKIIALEEHYCLPAVSEAWERLTPEIKGGIFFHPKALGEKLEEFAEKRLQRMDAMGVDVQVLSMTTPAAQVFDPATAIALARLSNDAGARATTAHPDRFQCFATLPTTAAPSQAVAELKRCIEELGFKGWLVNGRSLNRHLDHPDFFPIFEAAAKLRVPVYLHPQLPAKAVRDAYYSELSFGSAMADSRFAGPGFGWHVETGIQAVRLILSGIFDRLPDLQIILGHWGETVVPYMDRIDGISRVAPGKLARTVPEYFRNNFHLTPSGMFTGGFLPPGDRVDGRRSHHVFRGRPFRLVAGRGSATIHRGGAANRG